MTSTTTLAALQSLLSMGLRGGEPEFRHTLNKLGAELKARCVAGPNAPFNREYVVTAMSALRRIRSHANSELRLQALLDCYLYFFVNGDNLLAIETAEQMKALAEHVGDLRFLAKAHTSLGVIHAEQHRLGDAVVSYLRVIELSADFGDPLYEAAAWINLGTALNY